MQDNIPADVRVTNSRGNSVLCDILVEQFASWSVERPEYYRR